MISPGDPADQRERDRIHDDLDHTLFVEAGAGSGKTRSLVGRVLQLVITGTADLRQIAAITFTEKAGAELRDRIRKELTEQAGDPAAAAEVRERCNAALDELDGAAIGTLHSFAQRILSENPVEAGLPPRVEVLDEVSSNLAFERRWERDRDLLLADPSLERAILLLEASGVKFESLRALAVAFDENWDLVAERVPAEAPTLPSVQELAGPLLERVREVCRHSAECSDPADRLAGRLHDFAHYVDQVSEISDELDLLAELRGDGEMKRPSFRPGNAGSKDAWGGASVKQTVADAIRALEPEFAQAVAHVADACVRSVATVIRTQALTAVQARREAGHLTFHDLLVMARELLTHPDHGGAVRRRLHDRYQRLLLDEFQDTDPIQVELAVRIAAARPDAPETGTLPWDQVEVEPGRLFLVGDPKQSIYRFRRADISVFLAARQRFGGLGGGGLVSLSTNFRSVSPVIDRVNRIFETLMGEGAGGAHDPDLPVASQPAYAPLNPRRPAPPVGPAVSVLGREPVDGSEGGTTAGELRAAEAEQVAATVARAHLEGWSVRSGDSDDSWRPARLGDITILVPARTSLPFLEEALDARNIAYRAESSSLVYSSRTIRDLLMTLRAADDPTDHLAIVSALRTPLFGCGDDDLFRFKVEQGGHWGFLSPQPDPVTDGPVADGLAYLREIHDARHWSSPAELLDRIARDRRLFEMGFAEGRTRDVWRRLRYVIDQARAWSEASAGGTREYLRWVAHQTADGARVAEAVLPETDDDAVRIMTIHAAKGLEFPITIVSGMSTLPQGHRASAEVVFPPTGGVGYRFGKNVQTQEFEEWVPLDEQMGFHERIRLLYVACTRAEDHLVVSLQRKVQADPVESKLTNAQLLVQGLGDELDLLPDAVPDHIAAVELEAPVPPGPPPTFGEWRASLDAALATGSRPTTVAATALTEEGTPDTGAHVVTPPGTVDPTLSAHPGAHDDAESIRGPSPEEPERPAAGLQKRPRDLDLPPWLKGRYGTAVGRAVHGVLQLIDLATGEGLDAAVAAQCEAEAIPGRREDVAALVRLALESDTISAAASEPHWREVYACTPVGDRMLEGYIDLLHRSADGLVVVDYKTSGSSDPADLAERVEGYRLQGAAYALTVAATTGEPVVRVTFLFLTPAGAVAIDLPDLETAVADVERLVLEGSELVIA